MNEEYTKCVVQSVNQYVVAVTVGSVCDEFFDKIEIAPDKTMLCLLKVLGQVALNGILVKTSLDFLHGSPPPAGYTDPTGGYLYMFGLYDSQPKLRASSKKVLYDLRKMFNARMDQTLTTGTPGDTKTLYSEDVIPKPGSLSEEQSVGAY